MKKLLSLFAQGVLSSSFVFSVSACYNPLSHGSDGGSKPPPIVRDIKYYQELIEETKRYIEDCEEWIEDVKKDKDDYPTEKEYQRDLDELLAEVYVFQAQINDYQYQILLLEKKNDEFTLEQILNGVDIFTKKDLNLKQQLVLKEKYPEYYSPKDLQLIRDEIDDAKVELEIFLKLKEDKEEKQ